MTKPGADSPQWVVVDEGWGRKAADFATLSEPGNCREYVAVHHRLGVDAGVRLLDVACGSGLAIELARLRGAFLLGYRCLGQAGRGGPGTGTRTATSGPAICTPCPWDAASFNVVTSFRGIWGTTPEGGRRDLPGPATRRMGRDDGVGSPEGVGGSLGAGTVPPGRGGEGGQPGGDGRARPAWRGRAAPSVNADSPISSAWTSRSRGSSRTRSCTRAPWPLPARLTRPFRTWARLSSIAPPSSRRGGSSGMACLCVPSINVVG